jgi:hypothetical protein
MCCMRFTMSPAYRKAVERQLKTAQHLGNLRQVKYYLAILGVMDGQSYAQVALVLRVREKTVAAWLCVFCCYGSKAHRTKSLQAAHPNCPRHRKKAWPHSLRRGQSRPVAAVRAGVRP